MQKKLLRICLIFAMSIIFSGSAFAEWGELDDGSWVFYNEDGTIATNSWKQSGDCWYYLNSDGSMAKDAIIESNGEKYYADLTGRMVSNTWILFNDDYYFAGEEGKFFKAATANEMIVKKIDGVYCTFGYDGKWVTQAYFTTGDDDFIYTNTVLGYSVKIPSKTQYYMKNNQFMIEDDWYFFRIINYSMTDKSIYEISTAAEEVYSGWANISSGSFTKINEEDVQIGECTLRKTRRLDYNGILEVSIYLCTQDNGFFIIITSYDTGQDSDVENILNSLTMNK